MNIAEKIKNTRLSMNLTQRQFCALFNARPPKELNLKQSLLSRYESGEVTPPADKYNKILELIGD